MARLALAKKQFPAPAGSECQFGTGVGDVHHKNLPFTNISWLPQDFHLGFHEHHSSPRSSGIIYHCVQRLGLPDFPSCRLKPRSSAVREVRRIAKDLGENKWGREGRAVTGRAQNLTQFSLKPRETWGRNAHDTKPFGSSELLSSSCWLWGTRCGGSWVYDSKGISLLLSSVSAWQQQKPARKQGKVHFLVLIKFGKTRSEEECLKLPWAFFRLFQSNWC